MSEQLNLFDKQLLNSNLVGAKTIDELLRKERKITIHNEELLKFLPPRGHFDYQHLKNIHYFLFKDIYTWAGRDRYEMGLYGFFGKENSKFCEGIDIPNKAEEIFNNLKNKNLLKNCKNIEEFAKEISIIFMELNILHPFREGNGRTVRIFLNDLAKNAGFKLDLNLIPKNNLIEASIHTMEHKKEKIEIEILANLKKYPANLKAKKKKLKL